VLLFCGFTSRQQRPQFGVAHGVGAFTRQPVDAQGPLGLGELAGCDHPVDHGRNLVFFFTKYRDLVAFDLGFDLGETSFGGVGHLPCFPWLRPRNETRSAAP